MFKTNSIRKKIWDSFCRLIEVHESNSHTTRIGGWVFDERERPVAYGVAVIVKLIFAIVKLLFSIWVLFILASVFGPIKG